MSEKIVVLSHLMPAALYEYCRAGDEGEHRPVRVGGGFSIPTDRQTQDFLLCTECESILNKGGEAWLLPLLATIERTFPFYDLLVKQVPIFREDGLSIYYVSQNPEIKIKKLMHFALGIFWKASVHSWKGDSMEPRIELGPYSENLRRWLLSNESLSENIFLTVTVSTPQRAQILFNEPYEGSRQEGHAYYCHVPGVLFMMHIGKHVPSETRALCLHRGEGNPIMVSEEITSKMERMFATQYLSSRKTNALLKAKALRDEQFRRRNGR